ncbi:Hypothetical protein SCLAV_p0029 (plasmid) [Streptomyces clavuligerus]|uniref:Uncharacterized protein n=1 Tax=Streptomyces clavuligerus TaxID=1901 RepID=D5SHY1_STRCL|nr:Hypothetical protein SCLAV_p0029 [Streptomyces clavuligerus]
MNGPNTNRTRFGPSAATPWECSWW